MADAWFFISGIIVGGLSVFLVTNTILRGPDDGPKKPSDSEEE